MKTINMALITFFLVFVLVLGGIPSLSAQESSDEFTLEEITVTAEKRAEDVQKVALSVTAISGDNIRDSAQNTLEDVLRNIASVEVGYANRGGQINIRGIGSYVDTSMADPAVAVIEDNIYNGNSLATFGNMYDTERVEVLRGPQGTLYGRNATGGTINVVSKKPVHKFEVTGNLQLGDYNLKHFDGAVNIPMSDKWAARVAVLRDTRDGYLTSGDMDSNVFGARAKLLYEPNDRLTVLATYEYFWESDRGANTVPIPGSAGKLPQLGPPWDGGYTKPDLNNDGKADDFLDANGDATPDLNGDGWPDGDGIGDLMQTGWLPPENTISTPWTVDEWHPAGWLYSTKKAYSLQIDWDFGWGQLTAIPSYADSYNHNIDDHLAGISRNSGITAYDIGDGQENARKQTSGEIRLASPSDSAFKWLAGYYYMKSDNEAPGFQAEDPTTYYDDSYHISTSSNPIISNAFFGQTTYPVTDRFRVTGGIRFAKDSQEKNFRIGRSTSAGVVTYDSGWVHYEQDVSSTTYKAGIEYDVAEKSMLYAQIATGFKQGGMNNTAPPIPFDPEELTAYEIGLKNRFMDGRMQLNFEGFYYKYDNMQAQMQTAVMIGDTGSSDQAQLILNAEEGTLMGLDIETDYLVTQNDKISLSASFLKSEIGTFFEPPNPFGNTEPYDMTGHQMSSTPKWAGTLAYTHIWTLENGATVTSTLDTKISAGYYRTLEHWQPYAWNKGYHRSNFNVTYAAADGVWTAGAWIKNIENGAQYTWSVPFWRGQIKPPRTFGVNISVKY